MAISSDKECFPCDDELVFTCRMCGDRYHVSVSSGFQLKAVEYIRSGVAPKDRDMVDVHACTGGNAGIADLVGVRKAAP